MTAFDPIGTSDAETGPRVSVVVPLHNGAENLAETLASIHRQTYPVAEVLVIDDGSTDDGARIAQLHPVGARVITQPNRGVAVARNHGLSLATGDWVAFLDQDDLWHPDHLRRAVAWLGRNADDRILFFQEIAFSTVEDSDTLEAMDRLAGGWARIRTPRGEALDTLISQADVIGSDQVVHHDVRTMLRGPISMTTSFIADPALLKLAGGFAPHALAMDDYWLLVNVARLTPIARVDQPTVFYRVHTTATSRTTRLGLPFLSSAVALRLGGGLIPVGEGMRGALDGRLHRHLLDELLASPEYREPRFRRTVDDLARLIWPPGGHRRARWRARLASRMPALRRAIRRLRRK